MKNLELPSNAHYDSLRAERLVNNNASSLSLIKGLYVTNVLPDEVSEKIKSIYAKEKLQENVIFK